MNKIGVLVGERGDWRFFRDIFDDLNAHYQTLVFNEKKFRTPLLYGRLNRWAYQNGIRSILKKSDVCFFEWASELLETATMMPKYCPMVTRLHSYELYAWAPKIDWDKVDKIILVSQAMRQKFNDIYPEYAPKTEVVYNGKPLDKFRVPSRNFSFELGMLCAIHPRKRIYEIMITLYELRKKGYNARLHIAGERIHGGDLDEYYVALNCLVKKLGLQDAVFFNGHVSNPVGWFEKIDIFISNSYWEGNQVALVEALATGCYSLSHFWDGAEEVLPADNLYATESELQQKLIDYFNQSDEEKRMHQMKMRMIACEKFDINKNKIRIREIIEETS